MQASIGAMTLALTLCLVACSQEASRRSPEPETTLIGMSKSKLLACAGAPAADSTSAGREYLTYSTEKTVGTGYLQSVPRIPLIGSLGMGGKGTPLACEATIVLKNDTIEAVGFRADPTQDSKTTAELCKPIVQACLPL